MKFDAYVTSFNVLSNAIALRICEPDVAILINSLDTTELSPRFRITMTSYPDQEISCNAPTVEEMRKAKQELERQLTRLANQFTAKYGVSVENVERVFSGDPNGSHCRTELDYTIRVDVGI